MCIAGRPKCESTPHVVCTLQYGSKSCVARCLARSTGLAEAGLAAECRPAMLGRLYTPSRSGELIPPASMDTDTSPSRRGSNLITRVSSVVSPRLIVLPFRLR